MATKDYTIKARVTENIYNAIKAYADKVDKNTSEIIREAIESYLRTKE